MSNPLSHASSLPFPVLAKGAELHTHFEMWERLGFVQGHKDILCSVFSSFLKEFLACGSLS